MVDKATAYWALVKTDFLTFAGQAFREVSPGKEYVAAWYIQAIVYQLEEVIAGRSKRLIVNLPPRYGKSFLISVAWVAYVLGHDPKARVMVVSYSDELRKTLTRDFNRVVESKWYQQIFPNSKFKRVTDFESNTEENGGRYAISVNGSMTGRGADIIIIDDPIKPEDAQSDKARRGVNEWIGSTAMSRLDSKQHGVFMLVMQRLHMADLTEHLYSGGNFTKLSLPAIASRDETILLRGGTLYHRKRGQVLDEERENLATLRQLRYDIGLYNFAAQYQQAPEMPEGALFKREYFELVARVPMSSEGAMYVSVDTATGLTEGSDYTVFTLLYVLGQYIYIMDVHRRRLQYEELKAYAWKFIDEYDGIEFIVENANHGVGLLQYLRANDVHCTEYVPSKDKQTRAWASLEILSQNRVKIVNKPGNTFVEPLLAELLSFPYGRHDDQVDTLTQFLSFADRRHNPKGRVYGVGLIDSRGGRHPR